MLKNIGTTELLIILLILVFVFGGKKIPELFKGLGDAVREFRKSSKESSKD